MAQTMYDLLGKVNDPRQIDIDYTKDYSYDFEKIYSKLSLFWEQHNESAINVCLNELYGVIINVKYARLKAIDYYYITKDLTFDFFMTQFNTLMAGYRHKQAWLKDLWYPTKNEKEFEIFIRILAENNHHYDPYFGVRLNSHPSRHVGFTYDFVKKTVVEKLFNNSVYAATDVQTRPQRIPLNYNDRIVRLNNDEILRQTNEVIRQIQEISFNPTRPSYYPIALNYTPLPPVLWHTVEH